MHTHLGVPEGQQEKIWRPLFQKYNQSLRALRAGGFEFKEEDYWDCLRAGAEDYLEPAPQVLSDSPPYTGMITKCSPVMRRTQAVLSMCSSAQASLQVRALLESLPQEKWVFTNCNEKHATHALRLLGIEVLIPEELILSTRRVCMQTFKASTLTLCSSMELMDALLMLQDCFKGVIGADTMGDSCKPETKAFDLAFQRCSADPRHTAMIEDSVKNLRTAKGLSMTTVLVASATMHEEGAAETDLSACADAVIAELSLKDLQTAAPQLWHKA